MASGTCSGASDPMIDGWTPDWLAIALTETVGFRDSANREVSAPIASEKLMGPVEPRDTGGSDTA